MAVCLGEDERQPHARSRDPGRRGDVAAAAHHRIGAAGPEKPAGAADAGRRLNERPSRPQRVAPVEPGDVEEVDLVAAGGDELGLGAIAGADEADLGVALNERVGDGQRRNHVPRRAAGRDHHPHGCSRVMPSAGAPRGRSGRRRRHGTGADLPPPPSAPIRRWPR